VKIIKTVKDKIFLSSPPPPGYLNTLLPSKILCTSRHIKAKFIACIYGLSIKGGFDFSYLTSWTKTQRQETFCHLEKGFLKKNIGWGGGRGGRYTYLKDGVLNWHF
jgi:hypothetical protein